MIIELSYIDHDMRAEETAKEWRARRAAEMAADKKRSTFRTVVFGSAPVWALLAPLQLIRYYLRNPKG